MGYALSESGEQQMRDDLVVRRELYLDVTMDGPELQEIYLYQVDFKQDASFCTKDYAFSAPAKEEPVEQEELPDVREQFFSVWQELLSEEIKTECYATDAMLVMGQLLLPLHKKYPKQRLFPKATAEEETLHDCISMCRVVPMSFFDERQYLAAGIRRRMKEKYHALSSEVKQKKQFYIILAAEYENDVSDSVTALFFAAADEKLHILEECHLNENIKEEQAAARLCELLAKYPEADILINGTSGQLYQMVWDMNLFMSAGPVSVLYSMASMLCALGKNVTRILSSVQDEISGQQKTKPEKRNLLHEWNYLYRAYLKYAVDARLNTALEDKLVERLTFCLPVRISSGRRFQKQFRKNSIWKQVGSGQSVYEIDATEEIRMKYMIKAGEEQFVLRVNKISVRRYLREYAVLEIQAENRRYMGAADRKRICQLGSRLHVGGKADGCYPDLLEFKIKTTEGSYALTAFALSKEETSCQNVWLDGLFLLGRKKKKKTKRFCLETCSGQMFVVEQPEEAVRTMLVKDEYLSRLEEKLAFAAAPKKSSHREGKLTHAKRREIRHLYEAFRYLETSFGERERKDFEELEASVRKRLGIDAKEERLARKFAYYRK